MSVEFKDYYAILGVPRDASEADIKKAFHDLARRYHPDVAKDKRGAEEKFKEANEAYEVLGDPEKRRRYDELGSRWQSAQAYGTPRGRQGAPWDETASDDHEFHFGGTGFSDFFERFFGGASQQDRGFAPGFDFETDETPFSQRRPGGRRKTPRPVEGDDLSGDLLVTLEESLNGATRDVSVRFPDPETGEPVERTYRARIPRGIQDGQTIRLAGAGRPGANGGAPGDLLLRARFARHPDFRPQGANLYCDLDLAPWEAVLGASVTLRTLGRPVSLRVPPGTQAGQQLRLRGHGLPTGEGSSRGDLYAVVRIRTPSECSAEEKELWTKLARASRFSPRAPHAS